MKQPILLGVNIDHVATLRQARKTIYPDVLAAMHAAEKGGADGITVHLREDRRHIQPEDVIHIQQQLKTRLNFEMAVTAEMVAFAKNINPKHACFVPEKREELTTEGGLDVLGQEKHIQEAVTALQDQGVEVSLFIDPDLAQIDAAKRTGAKAIEIHTGCYAEATTQEIEQKELQRIKLAATHAYQLGLIVNAGHGLHYTNTQAIAALPEINELNIGHSIVARAIFVGLEQAVHEMKQLMLEARNACQ
jgi:pyridoxine 5-phosphate synthase